MGNSWLGRVVLVSGLAAWSCSTSGGQGGSSGGSGSSGASSGSSGGSGTGASTGNSGASSGNSSGSSGSASSGGGGEGGAGEAGLGSSGGLDSGGDSAAGTNLTVHLDQKDQTIEGFGINDTYAGATLPADLFDATKDIGLSILRIGMNSSGSLMTAGVQQGDIALVSGISGTKIIGSCWTPPASCKTNNNENDGGHLCSPTNSAGTSCSAAAASTCYTSWATTITNFAKTNNLYAMSIANEPDFASCGSAEPCNGDYPTALYTANETVAFVKVVGPMLQQAGVKVIAPETSEWNHAWSNASACCSDPSGKNSSDPLKCGFPPTNAACNTGDGYDYGDYLYNDSTAWTSFDIFGTHEYDSQIATAWPSTIKKSKEVWQTEMSGVKWWPQQGPSSDIDNGVAVAGWIHSALVTGEASAWLWWWYQTGSDNEGILLTGTTPVSMVTGIDGDTKRHYVLGNYSKFIRPGYVRVEISGTSPMGVLLSAFEGTDGTVVVVAINNGTASASAPISISGGTAPAQCTPWVTSATDNLASKNAVTVSGGSFTAALDATTVTTFVCK